ncbi:MAG: insulinase family protein [Candidatus Sericytochromatia bacterium]|nr:insulinase family protein [Candidatus Tanganyikabacteria bacterium]
MPFPSVRYLCGVLAAVLTVTSCAQQAVRQEEVPEPPPQVVTTVDWKSAVKEVKLANGMTVLLRENRAAPAVTWMVLYRVGSANEGPGTTGAAHLLEHMLFKGTQKFKKGQISQVLGRNGANFNASTSPDFTNYFETYSSDRLELGLMIEADRMRNALILDAERQPEMTVVRNELERGENNPEFNLYDAVKAAAFTSHPYHHPVIGYRSDVEGISTDDLKALYNTYYHPNNAVAILVGDFDTPQAVSLIKRHFEGIPASPRRIPANYTKEEPQVGERRVTLRRWGETNAISMAWHIPEAASKDTAPLSLAEAILAHGVNARLERALVDGGLATKAEAWAEQNKDPGLFWVSAVLRPGVTHKAVEDALNAEVERLRTTDVGAAELRIAKNQAEAAYTYRSDGTSGVAWSLGIWAMIDRWQRFYELLEEMRGVTAQDIRAVAQKYLTPDNRTVGWYVASKDIPRVASVEESAKAKATPAQKQFVDRYLTQPWEARPAPLPPATGIATERLPNGLQVAVVRNDANPTVAIDGWVKAGWILDKAEAGGRYGTAALTAALLDKGTTKRAKARFARDLESVGASLSFASGTEQTTFRGRAVSKDWPRLVEALIESLATPAFADEELKLTREIAISRLQQAEEQPAQRASRVLMQKLYPPGHPFHQPDPDQAIADMKALTAGELKAFHGRFFGPNVTAITVVGDVEPQAVIAKIRELTAAWRAAQEVDLDRQIPGWNIPMVRETRPFIETMLDKSNVEIRVGLVANLRRRDREYYAARVANWILGGSTLTGRLGNKLRDELGLTYGTGSTLAAGRVPGPWIASVTVNRRNVPVAYSALLDIVRTFVREGPSETEVADAKSAMIGQQAVSLASNAGMAQSLSEILYYGFEPATYWSNVSREFGAITVERARNAAIKLINPNNAITVVAGPFEDRAGALSGSEPQE